MNHIQGHYPDRRLRSNHSLIWSALVKHKKLIRVSILAAAFVCGWLGTAYLDKQADIKIQELKQNENN
jgi:hypothetical protein